MSESTNHVYRGTGACSDRAVFCEGADPDLARTPTIADLVPVTQVMSRELTCARRDLRVDALARLMVHNHIGCIPVIDEPGRPIGMVTKLDLVEQLIATEQVGWGSPEPSSLVPQTAHELMMPLALTLGVRATVAHAAAFMASEDIHHVAIVDDGGQLVGIVSSMDVVRWLATNDGFTATIR